MAKDVRVNERIRSKEVRLIGSNGEQIGVVSLQEAQARAYEQGLDLVEIAPQVVPPVCRIMDYNKFKYEQQKREKEARKHQRIIHVKEIKFKPNIEEHDYQVKLHHLKRFLTKGDRAKVSMTFRGREITHMELGRRVLDRLVSDLAEVGEVEKGPIFEGRNIIIFFTPKLKK